MKTRARSVARAAGGAAVLAVVIWHVGPGPFLAGLHSVDAESALLAAGITVITTMCAAWRWRVVSRGLGMALPLRSAFAAYYRSQFLNTTLPGGVLGDVDRAVDHGRRLGDVRRGVRAVFWERAAGQAVQVGLALAVLIALPSPIRSALPTLLAVGAGVVVVVVCGGARISDFGRPRGTSAAARFLRGARSDIRNAVLARAAWPTVGVSSLVVVAGHAAIFLIAARVVDPGAPLLWVLPLAMLVLLAGAVPLNLAGWGPREGVAAWAFGAAGLGAGQGVAVATVYGVLVIGSCLPGGIVLVTRWCRSDQVQGRPRAGGPAPQRSAPQGPAPQRVGTSPRPAVVHG